MLNAQAVNLISYIENPAAVVFWAEPTVRGDIYRRLSMEIKEEDNELKVFFDDKSGKYIDLYSVNFNDIKVFKAVDWLI